MEEIRIKLDFRAGVPIYIQIMEQIKHLVSGGVLQPGDQLPTVRQLASDLQVNYTTVARAYRLLDEEGVISTQHGRGTYILASSSGESQEERRRQVLAHLTRGYVTEARSLGYSREEIYAAIQQAEQDYQKVKKGHSADEA